MAEDRVDRRLAAIFAADIAGYSRLMASDEEGTLRQLKAHRKQLIDPKITEHRGRIVKTTGDGALVEFVSVVDAVRCAVDIQRGMSQRNTDVPADRRISSSASALTLAISLLMVMTSLAMASMWRHGWKPWPILAASWCRASYTTRCATSSASVSRTWANIQSRTSLGQSAFTASPSLKLPRQLRSNQPQHRRRPSHPLLLDHQSPSCRSPI